MEALITILEGMWLDLPIADDPWGEVSVGACERLARVSMEKDVKGWLIDWLLLLLFAITKWRARMTIEACSGFTFTRNVVQSMCVRF